MSHLHTALLEIGCEELPVDYIPPALRQLEQTATAELKQHRLSFTGLRVNATPRRLVLEIEGLVAEQPSQTKELLGPKQALGLKPDGSLTPAGEGFLRKAQITREQLQVQDDRLFARVDEPGRPTLELLSVIFPALIKALSFPKSMRWEASGVRFARPIRWLAALYGEQVVPFSFADVTSGRETRLHPLHAHRSTPVKHAEGFSSLLAKGEVTLASEERRRTIVQQLDRAAAQLGGAWVADEGLLAQVTFMAEAPQVLVGHFDEDYLKLPQAIVITAMREHQRYFAIETPAGKLLPQFLAVYDNPRAQAATVRPGCERVLDARLKDARFFYTEDLKRPLADRVPQLEKVLWIKGLGNLLDKTLRLEKLCATLGRSLEPEAGETAVEAAHLSKADLITLMIQEKEFNSLQGLVGSFYARSQGVAAPVAAAMAEQYLPTASEGERPQTPAGRLLALADKLDHLAGCFAAGFAPTGAKDPYALRRAAQGVIAITLEAGYRASLPALLAESLKGFPAFAAQAVSLQQDLLAFFRGRMESELANRGIAPDLIQALLATRLEDLTALVQKADALHALRQAPEFGEQILTFARVVNILPKDLPRDPALPGSELTVDPSRFEGEPERQLFAAFQRVGPIVAERAQAGDYTEAFRRLVELKPQVDRFFEEVRVMDEDPDRRQNRLHLLTNLARTIWTLADFSRLVIQRQA